MNTPDPWESVPPENRLDYAVIREPLDALARATTLQVERALPSEMLKVAGIQPLLYLMTRVAETTFSTLGYFCADKPEDPRRRLSFSSSAGPLLRTLLDEICTVIYIGEAIEERTAWYYKAGWRELHEEYERHLERYKGKPGWDPWLAEYRERLDRMAAEARISAQETAKPATILWWPTPAQMISSKTLTSEAQAYLEYMRDWFYRELSQQDHLSLPGLIRRGAPFLLPPDETRTENTWRKMRSDWITYAVVLFLAFLSEIVLLCGFGLRKDCAYLWGILKEYSEVAAEVWQERYESRLRV